MNQQQTTTRSHSKKLPIQTRFANSYYAILGLHPSASPIEIRRAYRELSKRYHPDTTELPPEEAKTKFHRLNEAYGTLSNPDRRSLYDLKIGYSRFNVIQAPPDDTLSSEQKQQWSKSAYLDPNDRPLSGGEIFALLMMGITLIGCLLLAILIAFLRGDQLIPPSALPSGTISFIGQFIKF
ncbi:J domain-containing protein [Gloeothece citriformis]|uniref:J domain-containing protein n=1 Tax=Gloeothece citriformis TaxID=2546356 RepID=UPI0002E516F0|nr:J domain-containing protein [Gloeothece citriformis]